MTYSPTLMPSQSANRKRWLVIILVVLAAIASGGITWKLGRDYDERRAADETRSLGFGVRPTLLWTLDAKRLTGNSDDVVLQLPSLLDQTYGYENVLDSATHLIAAVGRPGPGNAADGVPIGDVTLIGIDRADGSPNWKRPIGRVAQCTQFDIVDTIACWSTNRVVFVDTASGRVRSDTSTDFTVAYAEVIGKTAYVWGGRTTGASRAAVLTAGTADAPMSAFTRSIEVTGDSPSVAEVLPSSNAFTVSERIDGPIEYRTTVYDLDSGTKRFVFDGDVRGVGDDLFLTQSYAQGTKSLVGPDGSVVAQLAGDSTNAAVSPLPTSGPFTPAVLGTGAYDPRSGQLLWRDPILEWNTSPASTTRAVVGPLVVVASPSDRSIVGLDARTGQRVWQTPWRDAYWIYGGITDGRYFVFSDFTGMHAIDTKTGRIVWSVRSQRGVEPRTATVTTAGGDILRSTNLSISVWRARKGPESR